MHYMEGMTWIRKRGYKKKGDSVNYPPLMEQNEYENVRAFSTHCSEVTRVEHQNARNLWSLSLYSFQLKAWWSF